jgi:sulfonate transport system substrate-binding protein
MKLILRLALCLVAYAFLAAPAAAQEPSEFHVARQPGLVYIQAIIMEGKKLIEKHAAALGVKDPKIRWSIITSGGVMTEALISNSIDMAITGISNLLRAWGKTGNIKMVAGVR